MVGVHIPTILLENIGKAGRNYVAIAGTKVFFSPAGI